MSGGSSSLARRSSITIPEIFQLLRFEKFSGSVTIHFANGLPRSVEHGRPLQVTVYEPTEVGTQTTQRIPLDKLSVTGSG